MTDLADLIQTRRTVHEYRNGPIPDGCLARAIAAATTAPNHRMTEPWRFRQIGPETRAALLDVYLELKTGKGAALTDERRARLHHKFMTSAEMLIVTRVRNDDPVVAREDYAAVACAIQNLMLAFHAEGVGSKWTTGSVTRDQRTYELAEVDFDRERIEGFVWVGLAVDGDKPRRQLGLADVLTVLP